MCVEVRGQLVRVDSLLLLCGQGLNCGFVSKCLCLLDCMAASTLFLGQGSPAAAVLSGELSSQPCCCAPR